MNIRTLNLIVALVFLGAVTAGFFWLWNSSKSSAGGYAPPANLQAVEIETIKNSAQELLVGLENNANIPVLLPLEKMGRPNPFVGI